MWHRKNSVNAKPANKFNAETCCRMCLEEKTKTSIYPFTHAIQSMLYGTFGVKITGKWNICVECMYAIQKSTEFKEKVQASTTQISTNDQIKTDDVPPKLTTDTNMNHNNSFYETDDELSTEVDLPSSRSSMEKGEIHLSPLTIKDELPSNAKPSVHECDICYEQFQSFIQLLEHQATHDSDSASDEYFHCQLCLMEFKTKKDLNFHICEHNKEKKRKIYDVGAAFCPKRIAGGWNCCDRNFTSAPSFNYHKKTVHPIDSEVFVCYTCRENIFGQSKLEAHIRIEHDGKIRCDECNEEFPNRVKHLTHIEVKHPHLIKVLKTKEFRI